MAEVKVMRQFSLNEIRGILSDEIEKVRTGNTTAANVNAISNASGKILSSIKLELEYVKLLGKRPNIAGILSESTEEDQPQQADLPVPQLREAKAARA